MLSDETCLISSSYLLQSTLFIVKGTKFQSRELRKKNYSELNAVHYDLVNCNPTSYPVAYNYFVKTLILDAVPTGYIKLYLGTKHSRPHPALITKLGVIQRYAKYLYFVFGRKEYNIRYFV